MAERSETSRLLLGLGLSVSLAAAGACRVGGPPPPAAGGDLVVHPGVSAPVVESVGRRLAAESAGAPRAAAAATVTTPPFDCQAYARSLIPWKGPSFTDPRFAAANDATLPDAPEFAARRAAACALLEAAASDTSR